MTIPWTQILIAALTSSAFTTGLLAILLFAGKSLIERWLSRNLEKYKAELQLAAFEHQTRFTKLHEKRAEVIAELYKRLVQFQGSVQRLANIIGDERECEGLYEIYCEVALGSWETFMEYFEENRVYLTENLCEKFDWFQCAGLAALSVFAFYQGDPSLDSTPLPSGLDLARKAARQPVAIERVLDMINVHLPRLRQEIETEFRTMLGNIES